MTELNSNNPILEMRVAFTTSEYKRLVNFYCKGLGIEPAVIWNNGQDQALVLNMGNATLEIFDEGQAETIFALNSALELIKKSGGEIVESYSQDTQDEK
ncbi:MAG: hypothetical protein CVU41_18825 [Chloroflexi bacterium HGW-Chloroflexi-3]|nr:MAG: hypothetical protein CVU41_18825 [Chloroflexi bacterium HGW-Chloroflexi-3]